MASRVKILRHGLLAAAFAPLVLVAPTADAKEPTASERYMRIFGHANPPYGFVQFCQSFRDECSPSGSELQRFDASADRLAELDAVNRAVNAAVEPATDQEIFGTTEFWTIPGARGDCEDYAILKRRVLMDRGWPAGSLLLTVVRDEKGEGHAVLTARTSQGDFVLDNKNDEVRLWSSVPYAFVMRQSYVDPRVWVSLDASVTRGDPLAGVASGR